MIAKVTHCTISVAKAAPRTPNSGAPQWPKISIQPKARLTSTAPSVTQSTTCVRPKAER